MALFVGCSIPILMLVVFGGSNSSVEENASVRPQDDTSTIQVESIPHKSATEAVHLRARRGDPEAILALERHAATLGVPQLVALSLGRTAQRIRQLEALEALVQDDPNVVNKQEAVELLRGALPDPRTAPYALQIVASIPGSESADMLYEAWVGNTTKTSTTVLASQLVYSPQVRAKASQALAVALDLRLAKDCEQVRPILSRAIKHGDRRSLRLLGTLTQRRGCGHSNQDDCYACIRGEATLSDAILAVKNRPFKCTYSAWCAGGRLCLHGACPAP
ncbi:MAG: hypothetical protein MUF54_06705 [Polyangiaceae bacterium]|nr:hypothetical protein [Polyangiaceae bacterium]